MPVNSDSKKTILNIVEDTLFKDNILVPYSEVLAENEDSWVLMVRGKEIEVKDSDCKIHLRFNLLEISRQIAVEYDLLLPDCFGLRIQPKTKDKD